MSRKICFSFFGPLAVQPGSVKGREASAFLGKLPFGDFPHERGEGQECLLILEGRVCSSSLIFDIRKAADCQKPGGPASIAIEDWQG